MKRYFNINGVCSPERHYMVDISDRLRQVKTLVDRGDYFVMNRARQYGKTTTMRALARYLAEEYIVILIDFQRMSSAKFQDEFIFSAAFAEAFLKAARSKSRKNEGIAENILKQLENLVQDQMKRLDLVRLFEILSVFCAESRKPIVLMIDEVDSASNNQVFLDFLAQLRSYYLERDELSTFQSVILAGVCDIKNLKQKIRGDEEHKYNSPWNIAAPFKVDMSFSPADIEGMLCQYERDHHAEMQLEVIADILYEYTSGYPFLVSALCKKIDEEQMSWTADGVRCAVRDLLKENNTLFDDVIKNIRNNKQFAELVEQILVADAQVTYEIRNPLIDLGVMYGILKEKDGKTVVSNMIFETLIFNYFISVRSTYALTSAKYTSRELYVQDGRLNMELVLKRFADFMKAEYRREDGEFIERQGRLLFLSFLRPIINGTGHYAVEPQTRRNMRMDVQVFYGAEEFIVELKIWHGMKYEEKAYDQLVDYLEARGVSKGYLLSFCCNQSVPYESRKFEYRGHEICEVVVA